jgi:hypothetical protein
LLDLPLPLVARLRQHVLVIRRRQMRREEPNGRQRDGAFVERGENSRKAARRAGCFYPVVGGPFGKMQRLRAVREQ